MEKSTKSPKEAWDSNHLMSEESVESSWYAAFVNSWSLLWKMVNSEIVRVAKRKVLQFNDKFAILTEISKKVVMIGDEHEIHWNEVDRHYQIRCRSNGTQMKTFDNRTDTSSRFLCECDSIVGSRAILMNLMMTERRKVSHTNSFSLTSLELFFTRHPEDEYVWSCLQIESGQVEVVCSSRVRDFDGQHSMISIFYVCIVVAKITKNRVIRRSTDWKEKRFIDYRFVWLSANRSSSRSSDYLSSAWHEGSSITLFNLVKENLVIDHLEFRSNVWLSVHTSYNLYQT